MFSRLILGCMSVERYPIIKLKRDSSDSRAEPRIIRFRNECKIELINHHTKCFGTFALARVSATPLSETRSICISCAYFWYVALLFKQTN